MMNAPVLTQAKPNQRPQNARFSSGPCSKRPGWSLAGLDNALLGRSHRSKEGRARLKYAIELTKEVLQLPPGYEAAIVAGSDTGAVEMAMWNMLGARGVDVFAWEVFGRIWLKDAIEELKLADLRTFDAEWGHLPDFSKADLSRDTIFTWNGTTSGVRLADANWIPDDRQGLTICDATSALFAQDIDISKIDVLTYSWQKVLGGEAAHGTLILSPRAFARLEGFRPSWPVPKLFRLTDKKGVLKDMFEGVTINTPSMLCVEDYIDALTWARAQGGLKGMQGRADANAHILYDWMARSHWAEPLAADPKTYSNTSVCIRFADREVCGTGPDAALAFSTRMAALLEAEGAAFDILAYRGVPAGMRVWTGATVEAADVALLTQWLDWAYAEVKSGFAG
jgi:phosphoserine aminotransferase